MRIKRLVLSVVVALAGFLPQSEAQPTLGSADSYAALGGSTVTSIGGTVLNGNLGLSPGSSVTGFYPPGTVNGTIDAGDAAAELAQAAALNAYTALAGKTPTENLTGQDLGGLTLASGVYSFGSSADLTGTLTLNGPGVFVFQIGSTLSTASSSSVVLGSGAQAGNVFWQVGTSATLGTDTSFYGTILADASITLDTGANIRSGRALALSAAVTLDDNTITIPAAVAAVPEPASFWSGALTASFVGIWQCLAVWRRKAGRS
jgi:hypothetical protein